MRLVHTENLTPGMELGEPIYGSGKQLLLAAGVQLNEHYINLLRDLGIPATYVTEPETADIAVPQPIRPQTRASAQRALSGAFELLSPANEQLRAEVPANSAQASSERFQRTVRSVFSRGQFDSLLKSVECVIDDLKDQRVLGGLNTIKTHDAYTFQHSIDVTIMGVILAKKAGWDAARVRAFGIGCMLHDLGKVLIPEEILRKPGKLTPEEFAEMQRHPEYGYHLTKGIAFGLGGVIPQVAYQHHERQDGSGYPRRLKGTNRLGGQNGAGILHDFGSLCAVADVYDAMASTRPYRKAWAPDQVVTAVLALAGEQLNREAVAIFRSVVAPYPVCSEVVIVSGPSNAFRGVVAKVRQQNLDRPVVRVLFGPDGKRVAPFDLDLIAHPDVAIRSSTSVDGASAESMGSRRKPGRPSEPLPPEVMETLRKTRGMIGQQSRPASVATPLRQSA